MEEKAYEEMNKIYVKEKEEIFVKFFMCSKIM